MDQEIESTDYELNINPEKICRLCLSQEDQSLRTIFCSEIIDGKVVNLPAAIASALELRIQRVDHFPGKICATCRKKVHEFYVFKLKSRENEELLKKIFIRESVAASHDNEEVEEEVEISVMKEEIHQESESLQEVDVEKEEIEESEEIIEEISVGCSECGELLAGNEEYSEHRMNCSVLIQCYYCNETFTDEADVKQHMDQVHREEVPEEENIKAVDILQEEAENHDEEEVSKEENESHSQESQLKDQKWNCYLCQLQFHDSPQFEHHEDFHRKTFPQVISNIPMYKCANCCSIHLDADEFNEHMQIKCTNALPNPENIFYTDTKYLDPCGMDDEVPVLGRIVSIERQANAAMKCEYCDFICSDLFLLLQHLKDVHSDNAEMDETPHQCGICWDVMPNQRSVRQHLYLDHCKSFECFISSCDRSYQTYSKLFQHQLRFHSQNYTMECTHCCAIFLSNTDLAAHIRNECPGRKFKCTLCEKKFLTLQGKKQHELIHKQIKEHQCDLCSRCFATRIELTVHNRLHTGEKPFSCHLCPKTFRTLSNKRDHMSTHTSTRNFRCEICKTFFKSERTLRGHKKIHEDDKSYKCTECGRKFRRKQHLVAHVKLHLKK